MAAEERDEKFEEWFHGYNAEGDYYLDYMKYDLEQAYRAGRAS